VCRGTSSMKPLMPLCLMIIFSGISWLIFRERDDAGEPGPAPGVNAPAQKLKRSVESFDDPEPIAVADLLAKPRSELATLAADYEQKIFALDKLRQEGHLLQHLLPDTRIPLAFAIWQEAQYSSRLEMIAPPYLGDTKYDAALALHLARHGDAEGARK